MYAPGRQTVARAKVVSCRILYLVRSTVIDTWVYVGTRGQRVLRPKRSKPKRSGSSPDQRQASGSGTAVVPFFRSNASRRSYSSSIAGRVSCYDAATCIYRNTKCVVTQQYTNMLIIHTAEVGRFTPALLLPLLLEGRPTEQNNRTPKKPSSNVVLSLSLSCLHVVQDNYGRKYKN